MPIPKRPSFHRSSLVALAATTAWAACGSPPAPAAAPAPSASPSASAALDSPAVPPGSLARAEVDRVLTMGPPWLLRRVMVDGFSQGGRFVGWQVVALPSDWTVDLQPGDIVTAVNGRTLERPEDLWSVWSAMAQASELKVAFERSGRAQELTMPIVGAPDAKVVEALEKTPEVKPANPWGTVVIEERSDDP